MKTIEVNITSVEFRSKCHYRLIIDRDSPTGGVTTPWSGRTATPSWKTTGAFYLNQSDNKKIISIVVEAMVNGEAKELAAGTIEGEPMLKGQEGILELHIGIIKITYKQIKQNVIETLAMGSNGKSIVGLSVAASVYGIFNKVETDLLKFDEIKIKLRDSNSTVYGVGKLTPTKPTAFIQLDEIQAQTCLEGGCILNFSDNEDVPLLGGMSTFVIPIGQTKGTFKPLVFTTQLLSEVAHEHGVLHDIETTLEFIIPDDEEDIDEHILTDPTLKGLTQPQVFYTNTPDSAKEFNANQILNNCLNYPYAVNDAPADPAAGVLTIMPRIDVESRNDEARLNARMIASHRNCIVMPTGFRDNPIELDCALVDLMPSAIEDKGFTLGKTITAVGKLKEIKRLPYGYKGSTIVLEGDFTISNEAVAALLLEKNVKVSSRVVISVVPSVQPPVPAPTFDPDSEGEAEDAAEINKEISEQAEILRKQAEIEENKTKSIKEKEEEAQRAAKAVLEAEETPPASARSVQSVKAPADDSNEAIPGTPGTPDWGFHEGLQSSKKSLKEEEIQSTLMPSSTKESLAVPVPVPVPVPEVIQEPEAVVPVKVVSTKRPNQPEEMPGVSELEDVVHQESVHTLYDSFGNLYDGRDDEDGFDFSPNGSPAGNIGEGFSPKQIMSHKRATKAGEALAHVIKAELVEKQKIINRLMDEAGARCDAIDICGKEIKTLRDDIIRYKSKADDATSEIAKYETAKSEASKFVESTVGSPEQLASLNRATLIHVTLDLGERLKKSDEERVELKKIAMEGQAARAKYIERQTQLNDLTEAHMHQSHFIQKLQKKVSKMDNYKSTIKLQENIIAKMQRVVEAHLKLSRRNDGSGSSQQNELFDKLMGEIEKSELLGREEQAIAAAAKQAELDQRQVQQELATANRDVARYEKDNAQLKEKLKAAEDKVVAIQMQMQDSAVKGSAPIGIKIQQTNEEGQENVLSSSSQLRIEELEVDLQSAHFRIAALERELDTQASDAGREIARLRTRLFDFEMAAMLSEATDTKMPFNMNFDDADGDNFLPPMINMPAGGGMEAAKELSSSQKSLHSNPELSPEMKTDDDIPEDQRESWHEHMEVVLPIDLKLKKKPVGKCEVTFKFRYYGKLGQLAEDHEMEVIITGINVSNYTGAPNHPMYSKTALEDKPLNIFCDLSFGDDTWSAKSKAKSANGQKIIWDYNTEEYGDGGTSALDEVTGETLPFNHQTRFTAPFGVISTENLLIVCMISMEDEPNILFGSGHAKLTELDDCKSAIDVLDISKDALGSSPGSSPGNSPRPVPTGKLHHNMAILNGALKMIGKVMAYADLEDNKIAKLQTSQKQSSQASLGSKGTLGSKDSAAAPVTSGEIANADNTQALSASRNGSQNASSASLSKAVVSAAPESSQSSVTAGAYGNLNEASSGASARATDGVVSDTAAAIGAGNDDGASESSKSSVSGEKE